MSKSRTTAFIFLLLTAATAWADYDKVGDIDNNGTLSVTDVRLLADYLTGRDTLDFYNGHEWVDLSLPSGRCWATANVGASSPGETGGYYAWGETVEKDTYNWDTYRWVDSDTLLTRYCRDSLCGTVDSLSSLTAPHDAARVNMGGRWRMPTLDEIYELKLFCTWTADTLDGQPGFRVTGTNGNSIFLPMAGYREHGYFANEGTEGTYWTCELNYNTDVEAYALHILSYSRWWAIRQRCTGRTVRACALSPLQIYDINRDGHVSVADLAALVELLMQ